jgi:uncharacterized protein (DUF2147 family)
MKKITLLLLFVTISLSGFSQAKDAIVGRWLNSSGEAHVDIFKKNEKFYGKIVWLKNPRDEKGNAKTDLRNPDESMRTKPMLGLEILKDFVYEDGKWTNGKIYDPKSGKTYSCNISQKGNGVLNIRGYIGISIIGRTDVWKKVKS